MLYLFKSRRCRCGKCHSEPTRPQVAPEMLTKHAFDIELDIDHENIGAHFLSPGIFCARPWR